MQAIWNGKVIADSDSTIVVESNHYLPPASVRTEFLKPSSTHTTCGWKGLANYYNLNVAGQTNPDAAWYYPDPKEAAQEIKGYVAFWRGVEVTP